MVSEPKPDLGFGFSTEFTIDLYPHVLFRIRIGVESSWPPPNRGAAHKRSRVMFVTEGYPGPSRDSAFKAQAIIFKTDLQIK